VSPVESAASCVFMSSDAHPERDEAQRAAVRLKEIDNELLRLKRQIELLTTTCSRESGEAPPIPKLEPEKAGAPLSEVSPSSV
jgi:hypothetical protein